MSENNLYVFFIPNLLKIQVIKMKIMASWVTLPAIIGAEYDAASAASRYTERQSTTKTSGFRYGKFSGRGELHARI
jgi:hypothetical protein